MKKLNYDELNNNLFADEFLEKLNENAEKLNFDIPEAIQELITYTIQTMYWDARLKYKAEYDFYRDKKISGIATNIDKLFDIYINSKYAKYENASKNKLDFFNRIKLFYEPDLELMLESDLEWIINYYSDN